MNEYAKKFTEQEYEFEEYLSSDEKTSLVRDKKTGMLYVKKEAEKDVLKIYSRLIGMRCEGMAYVTKVTEDYALLEYINGIPLDKKLERDGVMGCEEAKKHMIALCDAVAKLHKNGIIHRDITAANIIISRQGCYLTDLGIAREKKQDKRSDTQILGTVGYAAPEQFGFMQSDERTDIYALGVVYNYMLTGCLPNEKLYSGREERIIKKCIEIDGKNRYKNVQALKKSLTKDKTAYKKVIIAILSVIAVMLLVLNILLARTYTLHDNIPQTTPQSTPQTVPNAENTLAPSAAESITTDNKETYFTYADYDKIENGMTYEDIVSILGRDGKPFTDSNVGGKHNVTYIWYANSDQDAHVLVNFEDEKVTSKSAYYLE